MAMKKIPHPRLKPQMGDSQYRLLLQFRQPRDAGQQAQDASPGGGAAYHDPVHVAHHGGVADGRHGGLSDGFQRTNASGLGIILSINRVSTLKKSEKSKQLLA